MIGLEKLSDTQNVNVPTMIHNHAEVYIKKGRGEWEWMKMCGLQNSDPKKKKLRLLENAIFSTFKCQDQKNVGGIFFQKKKKNSFSFPSIYIDTVTIYKKCGL